MRLIRIAALAVTLVAGPALAKTAPDLTGVWSIVGYSPSLKPVDGKPIPLKPEAKAVYDQHLASAKKGDRAFDGLTYCLPPGLPRLTVQNKPFEILQHPKVIYFVHQENRLPRRAYIDEKPPEDADPAYLGHSVAHWDGASLVVESSAFSDDTLLDDAGLPHSDALGLTERYTLGKGGKSLTIRFTIDDPKTFSHPWTAEAHYRKRPGFEIPEEVCADRLKSVAPKR